MSLAPTIPLKKAVVGIKACSTMALWRLDSCRDMSLCIRGLHWQSQTPTLLLRATNHSVCSAAGFCLRWAGRRSWKAAVCKRHHLISGKVYKSSLGAASLSFSSVHLRVVQGTAIAHISSRQAKAQLSCSFPLSSLSYNQIWSSHYFPTHQGIRGMLVNVVL